jgi:predicted DNA binding CopG/RHH family protein
MKKHVEYTDEPLGEIKVIDDFLPSPEKLVFKEDTIKVTLGLSRKSVEFFKREARKHDTQYQKMIRRLLDLYVTHHQQR